jgi:hypothetical protein
MAVTSTVSNHYLYKLQQGAIDLVNDTVKLALMDDTFSFDRDAHDTWADVSGSEITHENGYSGPVTLANAAATEDDSNDKSTVSFDDVTITASGGSFGPTSAAIIYDDTDGEDTIVGCIEFGDAYTVKDGKDITISGIVVESLGQQV